MRHKSKSHTHPLSTKQESLSRGRIDSDLLTGDHKSCVMAIVDENGATRGSAEDSAVGEVGTADAAGGQRNADGGGVDVAEGEVAEWSKRLDS